ncbi:phage portal protein, partial [Cellulomonas carbonis]
MLELASNIGFAAGSGAPNSQTLAGFNGVSYSATADILPTRQILVSRARQLDMTCPLASAAIDRMTGGIIGAGLTYAVSDTSEFFDNDFYRALTDELKRLLKRRSISRL